LVSTISTLPTRGTGCASRSTRCTDASPRGGPRAMSCLWTSPSRWPRPSTPSGPTSSWCTRENDRRGRALPEAVEHLAGVGHHHGVGVRHPAGEVDSVGCEVAEVRVPDHALRYAGGERHVHALVLTRHPVVRPRPEEVGRVRQLAERHVPVAVPVSQEEIAAVVTD